MGLGKQDAGLVTVAILLFTLSASLRAVDNMLTTTAPLLGSYVFLLGTLFGGIFNAIYSGAALFATLYVNPRLPAPMRKNFILVCGAVTLVSAVVLTSFNAAITLAVGVIAGFCISIVFTNLAAATSAYAVHYRSERLISFYALGFSVSLILGPLLETFLLPLGYSAVFVAFTGIAVVALISSYRIKYVEISRTSSKLSERASKGLAKGILSYGIIFVPFAAISAFLPIYAVDNYGVSTTVAYSSYIPFYTVSLITRLFLVARPAGKVKWPIIFCAAITFVGMVALYLAPTFDTLILVIALLGIPHGASFIVALVMVSRTSRDEERNATNSTMTASYSIFTIIVPVVVSAVAQFVGLRDAFVLLLIPSMVIALILLNAFRRDGLSSVDPL